MQIILIGMRVAGKTYFGKKIAEKLQFSFVDLDDYIVEKNKMTIAEMVETKGWDFFREKEYEAFLDSLKKDKVIIAAGAGLVTFEKNQSLLEKQKFVIWVKTPEKVMLDYLKGGENKHRPSLTGKSLEEEFLEVYEERKPLYKKLANFIFDTEKDLEEVLKKMKEEFLI